MPIFFLRSADGAIGAHGNAVQEAYRDFRQLAERITKRMGLDRPSAGVLIDRDRQPTAPQPANATGSPREPSRPR